MVNLPEEEDKMTEKQKNTLYEATQSRIVNFNEIGITNDLMFGTVYKDPEYCKELFHVVFILPFFFLIFLMEER